MDVKIYLLNLEMKQRQLVGTLRTHTIMNEWLRNNGYVNYIYELWKGLDVHSRWKWKEKKNRWGRMETPSKK